MIPDQDELLREIPKLKEQPNLNAELAAPSEFIPVPDDWEERSPFIRRKGTISFHHFDPLAQAFSRAEPATHGISLLHFRMTPSPTRASVPRYFQDRKGPRPEPAFL